MPQLNTPPRRPRPVAPARRAFTSFNTPSGVVRTARALLSNALLRFAVFGLSALALTSFAATDAAAQAFAPVLRLTDASGGGTVVGDFNGDGVPDIAVASGGNAFGGSVGIYLGKADGTFQPRVSYPALINTLTMDFADFNADGKLDLAVANFWSDAAAGVLLGNGDGTFRPRADFDLEGDSAREIHVADFNGDGKPDLVVLTSSVVNILLGNGDGSFQPRRTWGAGASPDSVTTGDFNGDGKLDAAVAGDKVGSPTDSRVTVLLGDGAGSFSSSNDFTCGWGPEVVLARDMNGDGKLDLVTNNHRDQTLSVLPGNGDGTFRPKLDTPARVFFQMQSMQVGDIDGDGKLDAAVGVPEGISVTLGRGDGTFDGPRLFGESGARWLNLGDLDRDGRPDVLAGNFNGASLDIYLNRAGGRALSGTVRDDQGAPLAGATVTLTGSGVGPATSVAGADGAYAFRRIPSTVLTLTPMKRHYTFAPAARAFEGLPSDATADFTGTLNRHNITGIVRDNTGARRRGVTVSIGGGASAATTSAGDGSFAFNSLPAGAGYTITASLPRHRTTGGTITELSSDRSIFLTLFPQTFEISGSILDTTRNLGMSGLTVTLGGSASMSMTADSGSFTFRNLPIGGDYTVTVSDNYNFGALFTNRVLTPPLSRRVADLESDLTFNFEGKTFTERVGSEPRAVVTADFDRDGNADVATANVAVGSEGGSVSVLLGRGDGTFRPETRLPAGEVLAELLTGDFDADGKADLAVASTNRRDVSVHLGNGDGTFRPRAAYEVNGGPVSMASGDFNGDGKTDLVIIGTLNPDLLTQGPGMRVLLNKGDGSFDVRGFNMLAASPRSVRAGDFNGDGRDDLVLAYETAGVSVLPGDGNGTFGAPVNFDLGRPLGPRHAAPADINGDGRLDLLAVDGAYSSANLHALLGNGDFTFRKASSFGGGLGSGGGFVEPLALKDFNGDGRVDLVIMPGLPSSDGMGAYLGNGDGTFSPAHAGFTGYGLRAVAAGDFNNDGRADAVVARSGVVHGFPEPRNLGVMVNVSSSPAFKFGTQFHSVSEKDGAVTLTVTRTGDLSGAASVNYSTSDGTATDRGDYTAALGTLRFAPGEASKTFTVFLTADALTENSETFTVSLGSPAGASLATPAVAAVTIANDAGVPASPNPVDDTAFFVRQHYRDFLNREPDAEGLAFWTNDIEKCGADARCREVKRIHVSAAFFLSIEFQDTGFYVYRLNQAAFNAGSSLRLRSFLPDTREVGRGLIVGASGWEQQLQANKEAFAREFVSRPAFAAAYPASMTPAQFVEALNANTRDPLNPSAGGALTQAERERLALQLAAAGDPVQARAEVLRAVAENAEFRRRQSNTAFVLMQYFGYLRRNPNDPPDTDYAGHQFWLGKLNEFQGDFIRAEMVKAFLDSTEYRNRFGQ
jgi:hypothetical protein